MSQYSSEHEPGVLTDESVTVLTTQVHAGPDPYLTNDPAARQSESDQGKAADVKDSAKEAGQHVTDVAKDQAGNVAAEAKSQAKELLGQGREELRQQAADQQARVASGLHSLSAELHTMASGSTEQGVAADLAREAADRARAIAGWLESREPGQLVDEVKSFARQRPGAFLGIAATAGVLVGRLGRGLKEGEPHPPRHASPSPTDMRPGLTDPLLDHDPLRGNGSEPGRM
jgi:ElaB/YqjD/DUF883 family membrane-anchored ribosome-binding protein